MGEPAGAAAVTPPAVLGVPAAPVLPAALTEFPPPFARRTATRVQDSAHFRPHGVTRNEPKQQANPQETHVQSCDDPKSRSLHALDQWKARARAVTKKDTSLFEPGKLLLPPGHVSTLRSPSHSRRPISSMPARAC